MTPDNFNSFTGETSKRFIKYGMLWTPNAIVWLVDRFPVRVINANTNEVVRVNRDDLTLTKEYDLPNPTPNLHEVFGYDHSIILNMAVGGAMPGYYGYTGKESGGGYDNGNLAADIPGTMEIDYVKVWQAEYGAVPPGGGLETFKYTAVEDRQIDRATPNTVSPNESSLGVDNDAKTDSLLKFDVSIPEDRKPVKVQLKLYSNNGSPDGGAVSLVDNDWDQTSVTWNNAPETLQRAAGSDWPGPDWGLEDHRSHAGTNRSGRVDPKSGLRQALDATRSGSARRTTTAPTTTRVRTAVRSRNWWS